MSGDKVLVLENLGSDYGSYFVTRGFVELLGADRVRMWPYKNTNEGGADSYPERCKPGDGSQVLQVRGGQVVYGPYFTGSELWNHRALWRQWKPEKNVGDARLADDHPVHHTRPCPLGIPRASDEEIFDLVRRGAFGLVVMNGPRWQNSAALHELHTTFGQALPPLVLCDNEDYPQRRWDYTDAFRPAVYFKRTLLRGGHPADHVLGHRPEVLLRPLPFSSMWDLPWVPWAEREIDVFCVFGPTQVTRQKVREVTLEVCAAYPHLRVVTAIGHPQLHPEYLRTLQRCKIVVDHQSYGTDTLRFWEASAAGCCLLSDFNLVTPPAQIEPGVHFFKYDNDLSPAGDQQDFVRFRAELRAAIDNDGEAEQRARRLYDEVRTHHTNRARADYILRETRAAGHALGGLHV